MMKIFDCNCSYGEMARPALRYAHDVGELLQEMDFCGIDCAMARHSGQRFGYPGMYNAQLVRDTHQALRLIPAWAILPHQTGEQSDPDQFLADMRANSVKALWAFPDEHRYSLDGRTFGGLFHVLRKHHIPLFVKQNAAAVGNLMAAFPNLIVVAVNQGPHSLERYLRPLLDAYPSLYLDTAYLLVEGLIEECCHRYGSQRLLFGSGFPDNCSGAALLRLVQADISDDDKQAIAGVNLERLLSEVAL